MATQLQSLFGGGTSGSLLSAPKAATNTLDDLLRQNQDTRAQLAAAGVKDPTEENKPSALDRIFGPLDALGAGVRSVAYNLVSDEDVNPLGEMWKAVKGEDRVEGADILEELGSDNKWVNMLGGFAVDILLDPVTYLTMGYGSASKAGGKELLSLIGKYGDNVDDIVKAAGFVDDAGDVLRGVEAADDYRAIVQNTLKALSDEGLLSRLDDIAKGGSDAAELSQKVMTTIYKQFGDGGVKFAGMTIPGTEDLLSKLGYKSKELGRMVPGSRWFEQTFTSGGLPGEAVDVMRQGNEVANTMIRALKGDKDSAWRMAQLATKRIDEALRNIIPDEAARRWAGIAYGARFGDDSPELARLSEEYRALIQAGDIGAADEVYEASTKLLAEAESRAGDNIDRVLRLGELTDEQYNQAIKGIDFLREQNAKVYAQRKPFIKMGLFGDTGEGYQAGIGKTEMDDLDRLIAGKLRNESPDALDMRVQSNVADPNFRKRKEYLSALDRITGKERDAGTVPVTEVIGETFDGSRLLTKKGRVASEVTERGPGLITETDLATLGSKTYEQQAGKAIAETMESEIARITGDPKLAASIARDGKGFFTKDPATKGFLGLFDKVNNLWKASATSMRFPAFTNRNFLTNKLMMWQEDVLSVAGEREGLRVIGQMIKHNMGKLDDVGEAALRTEIDDLIKHGVLTSFEELSEQVGNQRLPNFLNKLGEINSFIENQARISAYHTALNKGMTKMQAGDAVNRAVLNYSDDILSVFEQGVIKRFVPFYKWTKGNLSKQTRLLLESPGKVSWLGHLKGSGEATVEYDKSVQPEWLRELNAIPTPFTRNGEPVMISTEGLFPQNDLELLGKVATGELNANDVLTFLTPILRTPLELLMNKDTYYDQEIAAYKGEKKRAPAWIETFGDMASEVPGLDAVWGMIADKLGIQERMDEETGDAYYWMNALSIKALRDFLPWMNTVSKYIGGADQNKALMDRLSATGVKPIYYDTEQFRQNKAYSDRDALRDALQKAKDEGLVSTEPSGSVSLQDLFGGGR